MADGYEEQLAPNLYFDRSFNLEAAKILPGGYYVTGRDMVPVTVLGFCIAACICDYYGENPSGDTESGRQLSAQGLLLSGQRQGNGEKIA